MVLLILYICVRLCLVYVLLLVVGDNRLPILTIRAHVSGHLHIYGTKANCFEFGSVSRFSWLRGIGYCGHPFGASSPKFGASGSGGGILDIGATLNRARSLLRVKYHLTAVDLLASHLHPGYIGRHTLQRPPEEQYGAQS